MKQFTFTLLLSILIFSFSAFGSDTTRTSADSSKYVYKTKLKYDIPITVLAIGGTIYSSTVRAGKESSDSTTIANLRVESLSKFNRDVTTRNNKTAGKVSDLFLASGIVVPWFLGLDKRVRNDIGDISLMYLQTMAITGLGYFAAAAFVDKYRPYAYNKDVDFSRRTSKNAINSFYGGHVAITAGGTFFTAQVYADLHPESSFKYVMYGFATAATLTNCYLRYQGGFHFVDDLAVGAIMGAATGILVPIFHRNKKANRSFSLIPYSPDGPGLTMQWRIK
jgi:membrane-associated phospholipid phosphatase